MATFLKSGRDIYDRPSLTMGVEEEYMVLDPVTLELRSHLNMELLSKGQVVLSEHIKPEMIGSMVEIGTGICKNVQQVHDELTKIRSILAHLCKQNGLLLAASSTHPFSHWQNQEIHPDERYKTIVEEMQMAARSLLIFGMHIHLGIEDRDMQIQIMNEFRYFLPHVLALTTNSPFWTGFNTGFKSYRSKVFERFPRTGLPDHFESWSEYQAYVDLLVRTGCIDNAKKIWWDIRPHPHFPTLEVRICDLPMRIEESVAIAALCQAIAAKLYKLYTKNMGYRMYRRMLLAENKWRAVRYGLDGKMIDFGRQREVETRALVYELLAFVDDVVDELGSRNEVNYIHTILENGTGADRQLRVYNQNKNFRDVVEYIHRESSQGLIEDVTPFLHMFQKPSAEAINAKKESLSASPD